MYETRIFCVAYRISRIAKIPVNLLRFIQFSFVYSYNSCASDMFTEVVIRQHIVFSQIFKISTAWKNMSKESLK